MVRDEERIRRLIGQVMVFGFDGLEVPDHVKELILTHYLGNIIFFSRNIASADQVRRLTQHLQTLARDSGQPLPLTISADQENGVVRRLPSQVPGLIGNMALGATGRPEYARHAGILTGRLLRHLGINWDLAPVLDVNNNPHNPVIGVRSFGDTAEVVAQFGVEFALGLESQGVIACGKHFPGHGDTDVDSHRGLPVIAHDRARLDAVELVPFLRAIDAGIDVIMTAHVVFPAVEPGGVPATLSRAVLTDLLRGQCGFRGVITTDCLEMDAISATVGVGRGAVEALKAGADLIMVSHRLDRQMEAIAAVFEAVRRGEISEDRLEEAAGRVETLKRTRLLNRDPLEDWSQLLDEAKTLQSRLAQSAVTRLRGRGLRPEAIRRVAVLTDERAPTMVAAGPAGADTLLADALRTVLPDAESTSYGFPSALTTRSREALLGELARVDWIVLGVNGTNPEYLTLVREIAQGTVPTVALLLRNPYDAATLEGLPNLVALYENTPWMAEAAIRAALTGPAGGHLPVEVSPGFARGSGLT